MTVVKDDALSLYQKKADCAQKKANFLQSVHNGGIIIKLNIVPKQDSLIGAVKLGNLDCCMSLARRDWFI